MVVSWVECDTLNYDLELPPGKRYTHTPEAILEKGRVLLALIRSAAPLPALLLADAVRLRTGSRFYHEARGLSATVGIDWRTVLLANLAYDLQLAGMACSTVALPTADGPVLARNMDWPNEDTLARTSVLVRYHRGGESVLWIAGWPGSIGVVTGMSARGFAIALNAVSCATNFNRLGYPVLLHLRRVLEDAESYDQAVEWLTQQKLMAPGLFTIVGTENHQRAVIERDPKRAAVRRPDGDKPLLATNDYRALAQPDKPRDVGWIATPCERFDALCATYTNHDAATSPTDEALLDALSDPNVMQDITAQHVIMRPRQQHIRLFVPRRLLA